ncbi:hypothetical protein ACFVFS_38905 [Kitasatospora sp. NPDC057692]|uniref:hypothetical protein n=1 Tax=Kitasatospora sp. NPDC057692 TaxID=3346215 RepID=UPI003687A7D4
MTSVPTALARVLTLLDCVTAERRLGGLLLFDLDPALLPLLGRLLAERLAEGAERALHGGAAGPDGPSGEGAARSLGPIVVLGAWSTAESIWLPTAPAHHGFALRPGTLVEQDDDGPPPVALVPDLEHAPLPVVQAALALLDSDAASVERLGHSLRWEPRTRWLAALPRAAAARLSPHLLDRFPLRADAGDLARILHALRTEGPRRPVPDAAASATARPPEAPASPGAPQGPETPEPADDLALLRALMPERRCRPHPTRLPRLGPEAAALVVALMPGSPGRRRDLALARTARVLASGAEQIGAEHVREAARLLGLTTPQAPAPPRPAAPLPAAPPVAPPPPTAPEPTTAGTLASPPTADPAGARSAVVPPAVRALDPEQASVAGENPGPPYPEDDPAALPPFASLRSDRHRSAAERPTGGRRTGVRPARDLHDLALVPTLLEAAKFQAVRRPGAPSRPDAADRPGAPHGAPPEAPPGLAVSAADLRQYQRTRDSGRALFLLLDHSCRAGWDLGPPLAPFLRWAYRESAAVTVVEFGHHGAPNETTAERYRAASLLDPRILASVGRVPGAASPLAHALDLTAQELRRFHRKSRGNHHEAVLVVVTDGRGNVPLDASLLGRVTARVGREGVGDALTAAAAVRALPRTRTVLVAPETGLHPDLVFDLAEALDAEPLLVAADPAGPPTAPALPGGAGHRPEAGPPR